MSNNFCHTPNINLFRGAAYEISAVKCFLHLICQNFRKFDTVCPRFASICHILPHPQRLVNRFILCNCAKSTRQSDRNCTIIGAALLQPKKLCTIATKKFLTIPGFARIIPGWARGPGLQRLARSEKILPTPAKKT